MGRRLGRTDHSPVVAHIPAAPKVECLHQSVPDHLAIVDDVAERCSGGVMGQIDADSGLIGANFADFAQILTFLTLFSCWLSGPLTRNRKFSQSGLAEDNPHRNSVSHRERMVLGRNSWSPSRL